MDEIEDRWDHEVICDLIPYETSVLDLGCGEGSLLKWLIEEKDIRGYGLDKDWENSCEAIAKGVSSLNMYIEEGLMDFPPSSFDYVIIERTLQEVGMPVEVLTGALRVGKKVIVSFPNISHWRIAQSLVSRGKMPVTPSLPYNWETSPTVHMISIKDFLDWTEENNVEVNSAYCLVDGEIEGYKSKHSTMASEALFVISKTDD